MKKLIVLLPVFVFYITTQAQIIDEISFSNNQVQTAR